MNWLTKVTAQLTQLWQRSTKRSRVVLSVASLVCIASIAIVGFWSSRPQFVALSSGLSPSQSADIVSALDAAGIANVLNFSGSAVLVPKSKWNKARLLVGDQVELGINDSLADTDNFFVDPQLKHHKLQRRLEQSLAATISQMHGVNKATVHIAVPESIQFLRKRSPATASVVLALRPGTAFSLAQSAGIVQLIAGAVEGLEPTAVRIMDTQGNVLSNDSSLAGGEAASQFQFRRNLEAYIEANAQSMLERVLGTGFAVVRVAADIDFTKTERTEKTFDPNIKVRSREKLVTESETGGKSNAEGVAGTSSNDTTTGITSTSSIAPYESTSETIDTDFLTASSIDKVTEAPGRVTRLTVAATVDLANVTDEAGTVQITSEQIESMIKQAVGFDDSRDDKITVVQSTLAGAHKQEAAASRQRSWDFYKQISRNCSLGLAAFIAMFVVIYTGNRLKSLPVVAPGPQESFQSERILSDLSQRAKENPAAFKAAISSWLKQSAVSERAATRHAA